MRVQKNGGLSVSTCRLSVLGGIAGGIESLSQYRHDFITQTPVSSGRFKGNESDYCREVSNVTNLGATNFSPVNTFAGPARPLEKKPAGRRPPALPPVPAPQVTDYVGRVSTFYSATQNTYCETYEPLRKTGFGHVWRIESRLASGRWLHVLYTLKGEPVCMPEGGPGMFDQDQVPLLFDPLREREFASILLEGKPKVEFVRLDGEITVYRSRKDQSVGIVREFVGRR
jgi:hypothetical protein